MAVASNVVTVTTLAAVDEVQIVTVTATGGTFTVANPAGGAPSGALAFDITSAALETALLALDLDVTVSGDGPHTVTFGGAQAGTDVGLIVIDDTEATGGTVVATVDTEGSPQTPPFRLDTQDRTDRRAGSSIRIANTGAEAVYIGGPDVDTTDGYRLNSGVTFPHAIDLDDGEGVYATTVIGDPTTVAVLETGV